MEGHQKLFFHCPYCEAGKKYADMDLCDDLMIIVETTNKVSWEERTERRESGE